MGAGTEEDWLPPLAPESGAPARWDPRLPLPPPMPPPPPAPAGDWPPPDPTTAIRPPGGYPPPDAATAILPARPPAPVARAGPTRASGPQPNRLAPWSLGLGIAGLVLFVLSLGFVFVLNLPPSVVAWVYGIRARRRALTGELAARDTLARWGTLLGIIGTVLGVAAAIFWPIALIAIGQKAI
jgi:hypothetical protein